MILDLAAQLYGDSSHLYEFLFGPGPPPVTEMGPREVPLAIAYLENQVPESVKVQVLAKPVVDTLTPVAEVAQVRLENEGSSNGFIVDFQALRTVSMIQVPVPSGATVKVFPWIGTRFDAELSTNEIASSRFEWATRGESGVVNAKTFAFPEVQTERLRVEVSSKVSQSDVGEFVAVRLPAPPSDLQITINGVVAWAHPGAVRPGTKADLEVGSWSSDFRTIVDITAAMRAAREETTGAVTLTPTLSTQSPGKLEMTLAENVFTHQVDVRFPEGEARTVSFAEEGRQELALPVTKDALTWKIKRIAMLVDAPGGEDRVLPSVGPEPVRDPNSEVIVAEMVLDRERAVVAPLPHDEVASLETLTAVRVWVAPGAEGAELAGLLYEDAGRKLGAKIEGVSLAPIKLDPSRDGSAGWVTLSLSEPYKIGGRALWVGVHALRGRATWPLGMRAEDEPAVLRGLPEGPFRELPAAPPEVGIPGFRAIVRVAGIPPPSSTLPVGRVIALDPDLGAEIPVVREGAPIGIEIPQGTNLNVDTADQFAHIRMSVEAARAGDFSFRSVRISYDV